tara:strand:+ start:59 stop:535 length:477 start_codon:yes stop_codon:yes gene_type:complete
MAVVNIRDTGRNSAKTGDVRALAEKVQKPSDTEAITAANTITAAESGTRYVLNVAAAKIQTLPIPAAGLEYWFYVGATEPTGTHTVVTASSANIIVGNVGSPEDAAGSVATVTDADTISFVASKAVHGDFAHVWSDGTNWYLDGMCKVQDGITTTQAD